MRGLKSDQCLERERIWQRSAESQEIVRAETGSNTRAGQGPKGLGLGCSDTELEREVGFPNQNPQRKESAGSSSGLCMGRHRADGQYRPVIQEAPSAARAAGSNAHVSLGMLH